MNMRRTAILAAIAGLATALALPANAAITVMGTGLSQACFRAAEYHGNPATGIKDCTQALDQETLVSDDLAATYVNRGILRSRNNEPYSALKDYNTGLHIKPNLPEAYVDRGAVYIVLNRYQEAIDDINKGIKLGTDRPHIAYYDRAIAYKSLGKYREAYQDLRHAVELAPDFDLAIDQLRLLKVIHKDLPDDGTPPAATPPANAPQGS